LATRLPDEHYPVLTDQEIIDFRIHDRTIPEISAKDCALFLWCTSSNLARALDVMQRGWGFTYKSQAVWDKMQTGTGLIFLNQHEVLLYGTRGNPPKPLYMPPSVFRAKRGRHSAKPPEVRATLERMYPSFNADTRIEMFCRGRFDGWTCEGHEARSDIIDDNGDAELAAPETPEEVRVEIERRIAAGELATIEDVEKVKAKTAEIVAKAFEYARTADRLREENRALKANAHKKAAEEADHANRPVMP
jgi:N6-adenosine-specific RNA methylase IME4